ncbi:hypothetical protein IEO21_08319 [Rhodonia placenta]|uniref:Uncharacterized protein n=1 Tax=Rhodonia placenta TaxID=104341 RepID=A0A8H7NWW9_9APHY|nr:hypothetical protein IEO21_08319 [Postia placenta]
MPNLPYPSFQIPLTISAWSVIGAPIDNVWQILVDFTSFPNGTSEEPLPNQTPRKGSYFLMGVHIPPTSDRSHTPTPRSTQRRTVWRGKI